MADRSLLPTVHQGSRLAGAVRRVRGDRRGGLPPAERIVDLLVASGLQPISVLAAAPSPWAQRFSAVVVHEPSSPEVRATALLQLSSAGLAGQRVLCLTPAEWTQWSRGTSAAFLDTSSPLWGSPQVPSPPGSPDEVRRDRLREASGQFLGAFHRALWANSPEMAAIAGEIRDRLERDVPPVDFPARLDADAGALDLHSSVLGAFHQSFAREVATDGSGELWPADAPSPGLCRSAEAVCDLLTPLLADLPSKLLGDEVLALYLLPGPFGTRLSYELLAVVSDDAPLDRSALLRLRLQQHLRMLPRRQVEATFGLGGRVLVLPDSALRGLLRRRLFVRPLRRLAIRTHRVLLGGEDVIAQGLEGPEFSPRDLGVEFAALVEETQALWFSDSCALAAHELMYGAWPALLNLIRGGASTDSLGTAHERLGGFPDPAQQFIGENGSNPGWSEPGSANMGRAREFLRDRGPMLVRIQEVAGEVLLSEACEVGLED